MIKLNSYGILLLLGIAFVFLATTKESFELRPKRYLEEQKEFGYHQKVFKTTQLKFLSTFPPVESTTRPPRGITNSTTSPPTTAVTTTPPTGAPLPTTAPTPTSPPTPLPTPLPTLAPTPSPSTPSPRPLPTLQPASRTANITAGSEKDLDDSMTYDNLPQWMHDYFAWHKREIAGLNASNWIDKRYLVLNCPRNDRCGGLSDRLKPLPLLLLTANQTRRLFFIRWQKPAPLEAFLAPHRFNWSLPAFVDEGIENKTASFSMSSLRGYRQFRQMRESNGTTTVVKVVLQDRNGGSEEYAGLTALASGINATTDNNNPDTYPNIYHDLFRYLFRPTPPVQELIDQQMERAHLTQGEYTVAHYRAFYNVQRPPSNHTLEWKAINAVNCASNLRPGKPVYFASDSKHAVQTALRYGAEHNRSIVSFEGPEPLHIELQFRDQTPADFYSVFVDLYLMGSGRCVAFGIGGFGRYALLMSYDSGCYYDYHQKGGGTNICEWKDE